MLKVNNIEVCNIFNVNTLLIKFQIDDTKEDISNYRFDVLRSNFEIGDYSIVGEDITNFEYTDTGVDLRKQSLMYFYKIKITNLTTLEEKITDFYGQYFYKRPDNTALTIIAQYDIYMDNIVNNSDVYILKKKRFGTKCEECWDDIRMQSKKEFCENCYNTGYVGGYYSPIKAKINYLSTPSNIQQNIQQTDNGEQLSPIQAWIKNIYTVNIGDIIIDDNNRRYEIIGYQPTIKNGYLLRQIVTLSQLPASNIVYKIPLT